jgi:hypothetical protein
MSYPTTGGTVALRAFDGSQLVRSWDPRPSIPFLPLVAWCLLVDLSAEGLHHLCTRLWCHRTPQGLLEHPRPILPLLPGTLGPVSVPEHVLAQVGLRRTCLLKVPQSSSVVAAEARKSKCPSPRVQSTPAAAVGSIPAPVKRRAVRLLGCSPGAVVVRVALQCWLWLPPGRLQLRASCLVRC